MTRRNREEWVELVREQEASELTISEFCRQKELTEHSFYRWRRQLGAGDGPSFVPVTVVERRTVEVNLPCGATLKVAADRKLLQEVFAALLSIEADDA